MLRGGHSLIFFIVAHHHLRISQMVAQRIRDLVIEKTHQPFSGINKIDSGIQTRENRRVFTADNTGAINNNIARRTIELKNSIAIKNGGVVKINIIRTIGTRSSGQQEMSATDFYHLTIRTADRNSVRINKASSTNVHGDSVACIALGAALNLFGNHIVGSFHYLRK